MNLERVGESHGRSFMPRFDLMGGGFDFRSSRDTFYQGTVDSGVRLLAKLCGWEKELDDIYNATVARLEAAAADTGDAASTKSDHSATAPTDPEKASEPYNDDLASRIAKVSIQDNDAPSDATRKKTEKL